MTSRRRFLTALALGGIGVGTADPSTAGSESVADEGPTELTVRGSASVVGLTGFPDAVAPRLMAANGRYRSLSVADVNTVSATLRTTGEYVDIGVGTAYGSFDSDAIAQELARKSHFRRVSDPEALDSDAFGRSLGLASTETAERDGPELLVRAQPAAVAVLDDSRIDLCRGLPPTNAARRLSEVRVRSTSAVPEDWGAPGLGSMLAGDVVAHAAVGPQIRRRLRAELPDPEGPLGRVIGGVQAAGIGATVGVETTTLRYALGVADERTQQATEAVIDRLAADRGVDVRNRYAHRGTVVVDATVKTPTIWATHERLVEE